MIPPQNSFTQSLSLLPLLIMGFLFVRRSVLLSLQTASERLRGFSFVRLQSSDGSVGILRRSEERTRGGLEANTPRTVMLHHPSITVTKHIIN